MVDCVWLGLRSGLALLPFVPVHSSSVPQPDRSVEQVVRQPLLFGTPAAPSIFTLFFFFFSILRRMGNNKAQAPTLPTYQIPVVFQFNPTLPLQQQQLALRLPGAWAAFGFYAAYNLRQKMPWLLRYDTRILNPYCRILTLLEPQSRFVHKLLGIRVESNCPQNGSLVLKALTTLHRNMKTVCSSMILNPNGHYIAGHCGNCNFGTALPFWAQITWK